MGRIEIRGATPAVACQQPPLFSPTSNRRIAGLDGLRAIAIVLVILTHLGVWSQLETAGLLTARVSPLLQGMTGVHIFFVLSGFLITHLLMREKAVQGRICLRCFYVRRALRILPLYALVLALTALIHLFIWPIAPHGSLAFAAAFLTNFIPKASYAPNLGHTWSLAVEEHFYLLWPLAFVHLTKHGWRFANTLLLGVIAAAPLLHHLLISTGFGASHFVERWTVIAGSSIALGCLVALVVDGALAVPSRARVLASPALPLTAGVLYAHSLLVGDILSPHMSNMARAAGVAVLIAWIYAVPGSRLVEVLEWPPFRYIGCISYGLYMWQGLLLSTGPHRAVAQLWPPEPIIGLVLLIVVAPLSYHLFEQPILALKARYSN